MVESVNNYIVYNLYDICYIIPRVGAKSPSLRLVLS